MKIFGRLHRQDLETRLDASNDYKASEARTLLLLKEREPDLMNVWEISRFLGVTSPFVSQLLNGMEERELIVRAKDPKDRRIVRVSLTDRGRSKASEILRYYFRIYEGLIEHLGEEDSRMLTALLQRTIAYMEARIFGSRSEGS